MAEVLIYRCAKITFQTCTYDKVRLRAMCGRELFGRFRRLIDELARWAEPVADWQNELMVCIGRFATDASALNTSGVWLLREELCAHFEHETCHSTRSPYPPDPVRRGYAARIARLGRR